MGHNTAGTFGFGELVADANKVLRKTVYVLRAEKKFSLSLGNGPPEKDALTEVIGRNALASASCVAPQRIDKRGVTSRIASLQLSK